MRLHRLELTAFGPFAEATEVDFDALGADGLFLLHGQTGAGKTTILDAIAFALYGTVPGTRREAKRLHSDHAGPQTAPKVVLEATIGGRRLRLERSPEYDRPKQRGTGSIAEKARATLTWLDGRGQHLSRIPDIGDEINRLLGMSADQFFQVVLLPQGDFARFLSADNEDREKLLERLFDTERFGTAEQWLADQRRAGASELDSRRHGIDRLIAQVAATAETEPVVDAFDAVEWSQRLAAAARAEMRRTENEAALRRKDSAAAAVALAEGHAVAERCRRRDRARTMQAELAENAQRRAVLSRESADARRAEPVASALADAGVAASAVVRAETTMRTVAQKLANIDGGADAAHDDSDLDAAVRRWSGEIGALEAAAADVAAADRLVDELTDLRTRRQAGVERTVELQQRLELLPSSISAADARLRAAADAAARLPGLTAALERATSAADAAAALVEQRKACAGLGLRLDTARSAHLEARERMLDLREQRLTGMAAELAGQLVDGDACAVCGSAEHPAPARPSSVTVTKDEEDAAVEFERTTSLARDRAADDLAEAQRGIDRLVSGGGDGDPVELADTARSSGVELAAARAQAEQSDELSAGLARLRDEQQQCQAALLDAESLAGALAERIVATEHRLAELRATIADAVGADATVADRRARLRRLVDAATALRDARVAATVAGDAAQASAERLAALVETAGFAGAEAATAALRTPEHLAEIESELVEADRATAHVDAVLAEPGIAELADDVADGLAGLTAATVEADEALQAVRTAHTDAARRAKRLQEFGTQLWAAVDLIAPMQRKQDELAALADVVAGRGANSRRMSLRSYVLAARLEEVALAGSVRLSRMSGGRYEFVHTDAAGPRGRRGGLGLDIRDDYTGSIRPAKTLSGGESFMASLALALGLADTVAAESGGLVLDTMFIDEGFGSLDGDALDQVMGVLDELRAGGRVVGVVSHVDEMRQRIPSRLHVLRGRAGSRLKATVLPPVAPRSIA